MATLKDIYLGSIDAKNELLHNSPEERLRFLDAFVSPPNLVVEGFLNRDRYYVLGLKGTGKTALLRFISIKLEEDADAVSSFVLFKTDIDEEFKKTFSKAARTSVTETNSEELDGDDFEGVWRWFVYRKIVSDIDGYGLKVFQMNAEYEAFRSIINSPISDEERSGILKLIPKIRKGHIEISKDPKLGIDFDWDDSGRARVSFVRLVREADERFSRLQPGEGRLNIFFDELELNYFNSKQYQRDSRLIRDLIASIEKVNAQCKRLAFSVALYCAIRSEVQGSVSALGKEINKALTDFGSEIHWHRPGLNDDEQPLLHIVSRRLRQAMPENKKGNVWEEFFPKKIRERSPQEYILHNSWYRPRDVVRLLKTAQDQFPDETTFSYSTLSAIQKLYSTASWIEVTEELKANYRSEEIAGIKRLLYGYKKVFSLQDIKTRAIEAADLYQEVKTLCETHQIEKVMSDLYRSGVVGNISNDGRFRFSFRGDDEVLLEHRFIVHRALRAHLSSSY